MGGGFESLWTSSRSEHHTLGFDSASRHSLKRFTHVTRYISDVQYTSSKYSSPDTQMFLATDSGLKIKMKKNESVVCPSSCAGPGRTEATLGEAVLWVADFDSAPVAGSYQADEAQQVGKCPRYIGGVVATCKAPSANLSIQMTVRE